MWDLVGNPENWFSLNEADVKESQLTISLFTQTHSTKASDHYTILNGRVFHVQIMLIVFE